MAPSACGFRRRIHARGAIPAARPATRSCEIIPAMLRHAVLAFVLTACSADSEGGTASNAGGSTASGGSGGSNASGGAGAGGGGGSSASGGNLSGGTGGGLDLDASFQPIAVRALPGLQSISFYERTGGTAPTEYDFSVNGPELSQARRSAVGYEQRHLGRVERVIRRLLFGSGWELRPRRQLPDHFGCVPAPASGWWRPEPG